MTNVLPAGSVVKQKQGRLQAACCCQVNTLKLEIFNTLFDAKVLVDRWRREYNTLRPHGRTNLNTGTTSGAGHPYGRQCWTNLNTGTISVGRS